MKKVYYLSTCNTCARILSELQLPEGFIYQDIKKEEITSEQLEEMQNLAGSYENLFSRNGMNYRLLGVYKMDLEEKDFRNYILKDYTFLKRPVIIIGDEIFIGNASRTVEDAKDAL